MAREKKKTVKCAKEDDGNPAFIPFSGLTLGCSSKTCPGYSGCEKCCKTTGPLPKGADWNKHAVNNNHGKITNGGLVSHSMVTVAVPVLLVGGVMLLILLGLAYYLKRRRRQTPVLNNEERSEQVLLQSISTDTPQLPIIRTAPTLPDKPLCVVPPEDQQGVSFLPTLDMESQHVDKSTQDCFACSPSSLNNAIDYAGFDQNGALSTV